MRSNISAVVGFRQRPFSFESAYCVHEFILELNLHFDYKTVLDFSDAFSDDL